MSIQYYIIAVLFIINFKLFAQNEFQKKVLEGERIIEKYYQLKQTEKSLDNENITPRPVLADDEKKDLKKVYAALERLYQKEMGLITMQLKNVQKSGFDQQIAEELKRIEREELLLERELSVQQTEEDLTSIFQQYKKVTQDIQSVSQNLEGEIDFTYNRSRYTAFVVDLQNSTINIHTHGLLRDVFQELRVQNRQIEMITNGGMFHNNRKAVGLLISNRKEFVKVNEEVRGGNFHLLPNGVFYVTQQGAFIKETSDFTKSYYLKIINPIHATQSGPMLVINGKHHPKFTHKSPNVNLRSGVGITPDNKVVFIMSDKSNTNFFQFATLFKDLFACQNALFLDGKISSMYTPMKREVLENKHVYGPIISVTKK